MSDTSQGPGWWQASNGRWYSPEKHPRYAVQVRPIGEQRFRMAVVLSVIFKVIAILVVVGGVIAAIAGGVNLGQQLDSNGNHVNSGGAVAAYVVSVAVGSVLASAFFGFFGYVLDIMVDAYTELVWIRINSEDVGRNDSE